VPSDFIDAFVDWTSGVPSPYIFRLWSAIGCAAGAVERRIWVRALKRPTYPNLFIALVASPGIGKGVIDEVEAIWRKVRKLHVAPHSVNAATLMNQLAKSTRIILRNGTPAYEYNALAIATEELGVLIPVHEVQFLSYLNKIFTNPESFEIDRVYFKGEVLAVHKPMLNILAGTQPGFLGSMLPEVAWSQGFTQRLLFIYSPVGQKVPLFTLDPQDTVREAGIERMVRHLADAEGELGWSPEASRAISAWDAAGGPPAPTHGRLVHYVNRRTQFMLKLMSISCISQMNGTTISQFDFDRALAWLLAAEDAMPDIFREMMQQSDKHLVQELFNFALKTHLQEGKKPIHQARIVTWLSEHGPIEKIMRILEVAVKSGALEEVLPRYYVPRELNAARLT
jgi:hypothetical protein